MKIARREGVLQKGVFCDPRQPLPLHLVDFGLHMFHNAHIPCVGPLILVS